MPSETETDSIVFRDVENVTDMRALEDLQIEAWGDDERDIIPLNQFVAARYVGGTLIGAYDNEDLAGFVYGFYGHVRGCVVHHSHMLAVLPAYRNQKLAFRLKLAQRERVLADRLADRITWTFDPLQSLNAHFNFRKLGVVSDTYKINVYGEAGSSFLHQNGTDRLFVTWMLDSLGVEKMVEQGSASQIASVLQLLCKSDSNGPQRGADAGEISAAESVSIEIPADINLIERTNIDTARKWRAETRSAFLEALAAGFSVTDYFLKNEDTGFYILKRIH
jgi:predicted GNAT superfamily acetyltransferase